MSKRTGNCFEKAIEVALLHNTELALVVHGLVTHPETGERHVHAWVEIGGFVLDYSNGHSVELPRPLYYYAGEIVESELRRYTLREARACMDSTGVYGPWDAELDALETVTDG